MHFLFQATVDIYKKPTPIAHTFNFTQVTIGDLHANIVKLLYFLIRNGMIEMNDATYNHLVKLYFTPPENWTKAYLYELKACLKAFHVINKNALVRILGDDLCDRGQLDLSILWFLEEFVKQGGVVQVHVSNHGFDFIRYYELNIRSLLGHPETLDDFAFFNKHHNRYSRSLHNLHQLLVKGLIKWETIVYLYEHVYRPLLRVMTYSICPTTLTTHLFSHAECGLETIQCVGEQLSNTANISKPMQSTLDIIHHIDNMNHIFQQRYASQNNICDRGTFNGGCYHYKMHHYEPLSAHIAMGHLVWRREQDGRSPVSMPNWIVFDHSETPDFKKLYWFHGHNPTAQKTGCTYTLDSPCGKSPQSNGCSEGEMYIDLISDHVPFAMLAYARMAENIQESVSNVLEDNDKSSLKALFSELWNATFRLLTVTTSVQPAQLEAYQQLSNAIVCKMVKLIPDISVADQKLLVETISSKLKKSLESVYNASPQIPTPSLTPHGTQAKPYPPTLESNTALSSKSLFKCHTRYPLERLVLHIKTSEAGMTAGSVVFGI